MTHDPDDDYSATELASHWAERPAPPPEGGTLPLTTVLRFGPGVPRVPPPTPAPPPPVRPQRRPSPARRFALPALALVCVLAFLAWQRYGPTVAVRDVAARTDGVVAEAAGGCGGRADIVGVVRTDGRPGTLTYRWLRSDGSRSAVLTERLRRGQREARLHLLWTFTGQGTYRARAELEVLGPSRHTAGVTFTYACRERPPLIEW